MLVRNVLYLRNNCNNVIKMHYRMLGKTGRKVSILGFGAMRLPTIKPGEQAIKHDEAINLIRRSIDAGVNYVDTAYNYHSDESELVVAKALKDGYRDKVTLATKAPIWKKEYDKEESFDKYLKEQLKKLDVETIDVYLFHALNEKTWKKLKNYDFHWGHRVIIDQNDPDKVYLTTFGSSVWHGTPVVD